MAAMSQVNFMTPQQMLAQRLAGTPIQQQTLPPGQAPEVLAQPETPPATLDYGQFTDADQQNALGDRLMAGAGSGPVRTGWEGAGRLGKMLSGALLKGSAARSEKDYTKKRSDYLANSLSGDDTKIGETFLRSGDPKLQELGISFKLEDAKRKAATAERVNAPLTEAQQQAHQDQVDARDAAAGRFTDTQTAAETRAKEDRQLRRDLANNSNAARLKAAEVAASTKNTVDPDALAADIDMVGTYQKPLATRRPGSPYDQAFTKGLKEKYPDFAADRFPVVQRTRQSFANGKDAATTDVFNRVAQHTDLLMKLADAIDNGDVQLLNSLNNRWAEQFGSELPTNLNLAAQIAGPEILKSIVATGAGGVDERRDLGRAFNDTKSTKQLRGAAKTARNFIYGQIKAQEKRYTAQHVGSAEDYRGLLVPETQDLYDSFATPAKVAAPAGPSLSDIDAELKRRGVAIPK